MNYSNHVFKIGLLFSIIFILGFCSPASNSTGALSDNGVVKFKLDGVDWISGPPGHPELKFEEEAISDGATLVRIEALAADGSYLSLTVYKASGISAGTYPITEAGMSGFYKKDFKEPEAYLTSGMKDNSGSITISSLTEEKVVGTFAFAIRNSGDPEDIKQITEGSFDLNFTNY